MKVMNYLSIRLLLANFPLVLASGCSEQEQKINQHAQTNQVSKVPTAEFRSIDPANPANAVLTGPSEQYTSTSQPSSNVTQAGVVNYGNGVYYFPMIKADFGNQLSSFLLAHRDLEVTAIGADMIRMYTTVPASDGSASAFDWGGVGGYFVTFREKK